MELTSQSRSSEPSTFGGMPPLNIVQSVAMSQHLPPSVQSSRSNEVSSYLMSPLHIILVNFLVNLSFFVFNFLVVITLNSVLKVNLKAK